MNTIGVVFFIAWVLGTIGVSAWMLLTQDWLGDDRGWETFVATLFAAICVGASLTVCPALLLSYVWQWVITGLSGA